MRATWLPTEGRSSSAVFSMCVSSSSCSAPTTPTGLHLYNCCTKRTIKALNRTKRSNHQTDISTCLFDVEAGYVLDKTNAELRKVFSGRGQTLADERDALFEKRRDERHVLGLISDTLPALPRRLSAPINQSKLTRQISEITR